jgi:cystathionine beta-lyase
LTQHGGCRRPTLHHHVHSPNAKHADHADRSTDLAPGTRLTRTGKNPSHAGGSPVNTPLVRASTVLFDSVGAMRDARARRDGERIFSYGARGTPTTFALEDAVSELEGAYRARLFPTGLAAIGMVLLSYLKPGDHVLMSDSVYEPTRNLVHSFLAPYGIRSSFFAADGSGIEELFEPTTRLVYAECPGSLVYEMCDLPRLAALTHARGALLAADNTWGSGLQYRPIALGADISTMAATKYLSGHSDVMMGTVATTEAAWRPLNERCDAFGMTVSPDDAWLVLRGIRTLSARLQMHERHALEVAHWLEKRPEVATVFCPALPGHPGARHLATRLQRHQRAAVDRAAAGHRQRGGRTLRRCAHAVRARLLMGRLREPGGMDQHARGAQRDRLERARAGGAAARRAGVAAGPGGGPGARVHGTGEPSTSIGGGNAARRRRRKRQAHSCPCFPCPCPCPFNELADVRRSVAQRPCSASAHQRTLHRPRSRSRRS